MSEPSLEKISDYENLDTEKKRTLIAIVFAAIIMGIVYTIVASTFGTVDDAIEVKETIKTIPVR